jgi:hypothetical protein
MESHIAKILHKSNYVLSETPKYREVLGNDATFDGLPDYLSNIKEADAATSGATVNTDVPPPSAVEPAADTSNVDPAAVTPPEGGNTPNAAASAPEAPATPPAPEPELPAEPEASVPPAPVETGPTKDELEKQVLQLQLMAMNKMSFKIEELDAMVSELNCKLDAYAKDVEEVKEPTHIQKFMDRKQDSHPYYYNLNDLWQNNTFNARVDSISKGYKESPDGGYVADFDDFQNLSPQEIKKSFDDI